MSRDEYITIGNNESITLKDAINITTGNYLNSATVTFSLYATVAGSEENGTVVTGASAISMSYVSVSGLVAADLTLRKLGTDGNYRGTLLSTVALTRNAYYWIEISGTQGGIPLFDRWKVKAVDRDYKGPW